jgi:single-strand DNA-binding protein
MNEVKLMGRVGKDPDYRTIGTKNTPIATFSLATSEFISKEDVRTTWHNIKCWSKAAEYVNSKVRKGDEVFISGKLEVESWEDKNGAKVYKTVVNAFIVKVTEMNNSAPSQNEQF